MSKSESHGFVVVQMIAVTPVKQENAYNK